MAAATAVEASTGTRRAVVKSEKFMEWQRELSSSRATYGGRKRQDDGETAENAGNKKVYGKRNSSDDDTGKHQKQEGSDDRTGEGDEPVGESQAADGTGINSRPRAKKQQIQRQKTDTTKKQIRKVEGDPKKVSLGKNSTPPTEAGGRMRRCKQQVVQPSQPSLPRRQQQAQPLEPAAQKPTSLNQQTGRRRQRRLPRAFTPPKEEADRELRSLTRNRGSETPPPPPAVAASKATKRSKRVAQRLANEEPPPPPLKLPKLHLVLTRKEIQEDWLKMTGHKYSGKPKKSTLIQRGLGLCTALTCPSTIRYLNDPQCWRS